MRRLLPYLKLLAPVKWHFIGAILCGVIYGISSGFGLPTISSYVFPVIFESNQGGALISPEVVNNWSEAERAELEERLKSVLTEEERQRIESSARAGRGLWFLLAVVACIPLVFAVRGFSGFGNHYLINYCAMSVLKSIRLQLFRKLQSLPLAFFQRHPSGDVVSRVINDTTQLQQAVVFVANDLIKQPVTFLGAIGALIYLSVQQREVAFILLCLAIIPVTVIPIRYVGRRMLVRARLLQGETGDQTSILNENLSAPGEIRAFNLQEREISRFSRSMDKLFVHQMKVVKYSHIITPTIEFLSAIGISVAIFYASRQSITLEQVVPIVFALYMSYDPLKKLGAIHSRFRQGLASLERIEQILHAPVEVEDPAEPVELQRAAGAVGFSAVSFRYGEIPALEEINLQIPAGQVVALVGPSGAGKSTLAALVARFYDASEGAVSLDGVDVRRFRQADLHRQIAIVSQHPVLFDDTVGENIAIGLPGADAVAIQAAARQAGAADFIERLPQGYDTLVGENGVRLSGGQRQRLALARAILRDSPILILDEATSALDTESEERIQKALDEILPGRTALIIAHRFSTIRSAHRIIVLREGRVVGDGPHEELYTSCALYRELYDRQALHESTKTEESSM